MVSQRAVIEDFSLTSLISSLDTLHSILLKVIRQLPGPTLHMDTLRRGTLHKDTLHKDTLRKDTLRKGTLRRGTLPMDILQQGTLLILLHITVSKLHARKKTFFCCAHKTYLRVEQSEKTLFFSVPLNYI